MAGNAAVTIRVGPELKREAAEVAEGSGLDLSTAIRLFYTQMVNTNALPRLPRQYASSARTLPSLGRSCVADTTCITCLVTGPEARSATW